MTSDSEETPELGSHIVGQSQDAPAPPSQPAATVTPLQGTHLEVDVINGHHSSQLGSLLTRL